MYYKDNGKTMDPELVDSKALETAKKLVIKGYNGRLDEKKSIKSSQLRKFYADVKNLERTWNYQKCSDEAFNGILPQIKILKAKAAYAKSREVVPDDFRKWLNNCIDAISTPADFRAFLLHFEAVVGFCYGEGLKN